MQSIDPLEKLSQSPQYARFMRSLFWMALVAALGGLVLKYTGHGIQLLIIGASTLAIWCLLFFICRPYKPIDEEQADKALMPLWRFSMSMIGMGFAAVILGGLFRISHWPGGWVMVIVGSIALLVGTAVRMVYSRKREQFLARNH